MFRGTTSVLARSVIAALALALLAGSSAEAKSFWQFDGETLSGSEKVIGDAVLGGFSFPGMTTTCKKMHYAMTIYNGAEVGQAELKSLSLTTCVGDEEDCFVESSEAQNLPWPGHLETDEGSPYLVFAGIEVALLYGDENCVIGEFPFSMTGSAGALFENATESFSFDAASANATATKLKAGGAAAVLEAGFTTEATGVHEGEALSVG
jgi:hypothetical protein